MGSRALLLCYCSFELFEVILVAVLDFRDHRLLFRKLVHDRIILFPQLR
jgi:hypothetical protein